VRAFASQARQCPNSIRGGIAEFAQTKIGCVKSFAVRCICDSLVTSNSLMKYREPKIYHCSNIPKRLHI